MMNHTILSSSSITSDSVKNRAGENLGNVKDIMIDMNNGSVSYVVVSFGGFLGIGDKYFAVPMEAFTVDTEDHHLILDVDKNKLENAPGFDKDNWPSNPDSAFLSNMHSHFGTTPRYDYQASSKTTGSYETRASERGYETKSRLSDEPNEHRGPSHG